uniref:Uncharacterized protein n=1 Tax=Lepeophtheirus salmonis TaxID=72036 RepID=A0A0K2VLU5_LEPSM
MRVVQLYLWLDQEFKVNIDSNPIKRASFRIYFQLKLFIYLHMLYIINI